MPSGTGLAQAKRDLVEVDKAINRVLLKARRLYVITLEVAIKRYQHAMWKTLTSYEHKLSVSVGSSGHHVPVVANIVADLHRIAELNLQNAANIGFTRALEDMKERGWIIKYDMPVVAPRSIVDDSIKENRKYLEQSLLPDLKRDLDQCKVADDVPPVIAKYRSRIFLYGHWSWRTAERAYRDGMKSFVAFADRKHNVREVLVEGGPGSGDRGHTGRKGIVGGSGAAETPVAHVQTAANEIGVDPNGPAPWDLKAPAPPRYPGDNSIYSPAIPDAHGNFVLGRRIQGLKLDPPNDPNQVAMYTFIPDSVTQDQLAKYEGAIKANTDHAQTHPGFIAYVDSKGELQRTQGNNYWIRADYRNLNKLSDELTPKLTEQFGKNTFTTMMTNVTPGGTQITKGDALEHMRVVVPFAEGTPKNTVGESSLDRATRDKILTAMSGSEGRHVWEHADFNGIHIAVSTTPSVVDKLFPVVTALGGLRDKEEETHHNAGATRFIPTKINLERYPVRGYKESFVEADDSQGVLLYFIGPDDSETCDGCAGAVDGNPYTVDDAPEPGEFECMARCRHMLQADGDLGDDTTSYEWSGSIGFGETTDQPDNQDAIDLAAIALQSDIDLDTYFAKVADDMQTLSYSADVLDKIDIKNLDDQELLEFVSVMTDNGIALDDLDQLMDLSDAEIAKLRGAFRDIATDVSEDDITYLLNNGDVDILQQYIKDIGGQVLETLVDMGAEGFDDIDAIQAETLAQVLNKVATLDQDGRWYVL